MLASIFHHCSNVSDSDCASSSTPSSKEKICHMTSCTSRMNSDLQHCVHNVAVFTDNVKIVEHRHCAKPS